jgi:phage terminase large subunit-like protein
VAAGAHDTTAHFAGWAAQDHLVLTDGDLIDFTVIRDDLRDLATTLRAVREIDFDPYQATQIATELRPDLDGRIELVEIPQTTKHLSGPMKAWRDLVLGSHFVHDGNPVMTWCVSNVVAHEDANENVFPRKMARHLKIDGVTAMLNALARALTVIAAPEPRITVIG